MEKIAARHILVEHKHQADDLLQKINSGESFEKLAQEHSMCGSASKGGDLGEFGKGMMVASFETAAFALNPGEVSPIVSTQFGHHIIQRIK